MNSGYPNPSQILPLFFKINRQARIRWTITQDSTTPNTTGWTWQLFVKRFAGARQNVINLTLGNGLRYEVYSDTILVADFSSLQTDLEEGEYYYEIVRTDIETTWIEGAAHFEFSKTSTSTVEESNFTINVDSNGSPITIAVANSQTINVTGLTQAQADALYATIANLALKQNLIISETALVDAATIDIAQQNNTLATSRSTITFTISSTATYNTVTVTLTGTSLVLTFPTNSLCVDSDGTASGDNTCTLTGVSGDIYEVITKKRGATYSVIAKNLGQ